MVQDLLFRPYVVLYLFYFIHVFKLRPEFVMTWSLADFYAIFFPVQVLRLYGQVVLWKVGHQ
jgi:hypothetical protein